MRPLLFSCLLAAFPAARIQAEEIRPTPAVATEANAKFAAAPRVSEPVRSSSVRVVFSGNKSVSEKDLREASTEIFRNIEEQGLSAPHADDAAFYVEVYYRRHGYTFAIVNWRILANNTLQLDIDEGPLTNIGGITYEGDYYHTEATLNDFLLGTTRERLSKFARVLPYVEQDIETGTARLIAFYESEGYRDATVVPWPIEYTSDLSVARLGFSITPGLQYWFGKVRILGAAPSLETSIRAQIADGLKVPASLLGIESLESEIELSLKTAGYYKAKVALQTVAYDQVNGLVDLDVMVSSGSQYFYDGITVTGTDRLNPAFLPARFSSLTGTAYNPAHQDEIYREMISSGLFRELKIKETVLEDNRIHLDLKVVESPAKEFGLYAGYGTYEGGFIGTSYQDRNLLGSGRPLLTSLETSQRGITGNVEFIDPWFFGRGNEARLKVFSQSIDNDGYSILDLGVRAEVSRKFSKFFKGSVYASFNTAKADALEIDDLTLLGPLNYETLTAGLTATYDLRNNPLSPNEGWVVDGAIGYEQISSGAGGLRVSFRTSYYLPIGNGLLAVGARSAAFLTSGDVATVPIDERYFNGGGTTVRSFDERQLGPLYLERYPLGGLSRTILNAEFIHPIIGDLKGAVFIDAGNVSVEGNFFSTSDFRYAYGIGLRYTLPVGPIRLDYGINPDPQPGESSGAFHFSFGVAF